MERKRGTTIMIVIALIISIIGLGVAFAAFSSTLTINGSATVTASNWKIYFTTSATGEDPGTSGIALPSGQIAESNMQSLPETVTDASATVKTADFTWTAKFKTPGDKVVYDFYVRNTGDYNAKITGINTPTITCKQGSSTTAEATAVCGHIHYAVRKASADGSAVAKNDTVASKGNAHYYVVAWLDDQGWATDGSDLPKTAVSVDVTQISITYTQY